LHRRGDGTFRNAGTGTVLADAVLHIKAAGYANAGTVASRATPGWRVPSLVFRPTSTPSWPSAPCVSMWPESGSTSWRNLGQPAADTIWSGTLVNTGQVLLGGNASNVNTRDRGRTRAERSRSDRWQLPAARLAGIARGLRGSPHRCGKPRPVRGQWLFSGQSPQCGVGRPGCRHLPYSAEHLAQTVRWTNAAGEVEDTAALSLARLDARGGASSVTLTSPDAGTIVAADLSLSGVDLTLGAGVDPRPRSRRSGVPPQPGGSNDPRGLRGR
ncbi:hypothetical protein, partial [Zoogloea sp.]|uniref:hypothetical protein n=1 Tax=Zoogloea sp. TaxID=49181 RepID=UPI001D982189